MTEPITNVQVNEQVLLSALVANRGRRLPASDGFNALATFFRLPPHLEHEITESQVRDFSAPKPFHAIKVQILKKANIKLAEKFKSEFPVMIFALSLNLAMRAGIVLTHTLAIVATSCLRDNCRLAFLTAFADCL